MQKQGTFTATYVQTFIAIPFRKEQMFCAGWTHFTYVNREIDAAFGYANVVVKLHVRRGNHQNKMSKLHNRGLDFQDVTVHYSEITTS